MEDDRYELKGTNIIHNKHSLSEGEEGALYEEYL